MTADAASLHCPNCGAPAAPGDQSCKYCHAVLATVSCPSCFALMFDGAAYCPSCGARRSRTADGSRRARCSGCLGTMREVQVGATVLMECGQCQATWVDSKTFDEICADQTAQAAVLSRYSAPQSAVAEVHYRRCVACGKMMNRLNFARLSGTIIDVCKGHGAFLDAGELHAIVAFIRQGGLDRARQRQIDELKEEEERIRALQAHREGNADVRFEMRTRTWSGPDLATLLDWLKKP